MSRGKKALITGITGQDGSYLAEFLLAKGYEVHGLVRRSSTFNTRRIDHLYVDPHEAGARFFLHYGDLSDSGQLSHLIYNIQPDEIYHLAAQSHVRVSFDIPEYTGDVTGLGVTRLLEAIRRSGIKTRFYQASSSELFGASPPPQNEATPMCPRSPYAAAKLYAYWMTRNYREGYGLFAVNGILFNHESPRRGETFVTRKITRAVARIKFGLQKKLYLGNLEARRRLGLCPGLCGSHVAHVAAGYPGRPGDRHRGGPFGPGVPGRSLFPCRPGLAGIRRDRPEVLPAHGSGLFIGRCRQGQACSWAGNLGSASGNWCA